jgi:hypothetical protein
VLREEWAVIDEEVERLRAHVLAGKPLLDSLRDREPNHIEMMASCTMLHGFYNGVEKICRSVSEFTGEKWTGQKDAEGWHKRLLDSMTQESSIRPALLSEPLYETLLEYLRFRHLFRHAYFQELNWRRMAHLLKNLEAVFETFLSEMSVFRDKMEKMRQPKGDGTK